MTADLLLRHHFRLQIDQFFPHCKGIQTLQRVGDPVIKLCEALTVREGLSAVNTSFHQLSRSCEQPLLDEESGIFQGTADLRETFHALSECQRHRQVL